MDAETINVLLTILGIIALAICLAILATAAAAWSHTRAWQKLQIRSRNPSASPFLPSKQPPEYTDDLSDSEIEDSQAAEREALQDVGLTTRQKYWKEFRLVWSAERAMMLRAKMERETRGKEREERRKLAREVARQLRREGQC